MTYYWKETFYYPCIKLSALAGGFGVSRFGKPGIFISAFTEQMFPGILKNKQMF